MTNTVPAAHNGAALTSTQMQQILQVSNVGSTTVPPFLRLNPIKKNSATAMENAKKSLDALVADYQRLQTPTSQATAATTVTSATTPTTQNRIVSEAIMHFNLIGIHLTDLEDKNAALYKQAAESKKTLAELTKQNQELLTLISRVHSLTASAQITSANPATAATPAASPATALYPIPFLPAPKAPSAPPIFMHLNNPFNVPAKTPSCNSLVPPKPGTQLQLLSAP